jgi:hypothetical protein
MNPEAAPFPPIMSATTGYYSLIQYCPDRMKLEAANMGVLLYEPESRFLQARLAKSNERIVRFFGEEAGDLKQIDAMKTILLHRLEAESERIGHVEDLSRFAELLANEIVITPPRAMLVEEPELDLKRLFDEVMADCEHLQP